MGLLCFGEVAFLCSGWSAGLRRIVIDCECARFFSNGGLHILAWHRHPAFFGTLGKTLESINMVDKDPSHAAMTRCRTMQ